MEWNPINQMINLKQFTQPFDGIPVMTDLSDIDVLLVSQDYYTIQY